MLKSKHVNKLLYAIQLNSMKSSRKFRKKWEDQFQNIQWKKVYTTNLRSKISSKLRNFQYKFLTRTIPINKWLYKCKLVSSSMCDFCNMYTESLNHLFWECHVVQEFWRDLKIFRATKSFNINFNYENISFGILDNVHSCYTKNFIVLNAKYFIFINKCNKSTPVFSNYKKYLYKSNHHWKTNSHEQR